MKQIPSCAVVGGGPAGLFAAECLAQAGCEVTIYDQKPSLGRKFLMAGVGGLNLTHSEPYEQFVERYRGGEDWLAKALADFPPAALRQWCEGLGEPTFVGSSGRVFPRSFKASPVLRAWLRRLESLGAEVRTRHRWNGWVGNGLGFESLEGLIEVTPDATVLALGGASWSRLGSDGEWVNRLAQAGVPVQPLMPSNCGFLVSWSEYFAARHAGSPLKSIHVSCGNSHAAGEAMITERGIEGGAIYALSPILRDRINASGEVTMHVDLKPDLSATEIAKRLARVRSGDSLKNKLRKAVRLPPVAVDLLREAVGDLPVCPESLAGLLKATPLTLIAPAPLEYAISTAGGIAATGFDTSMMLRVRPGVFVAGEMLDWEAPTGGYLLQACFASAKAAAEGAIAWLATQRS